MRNYDYVSYVYETPIQRYVRDALTTAAKQSQVRASRYHGEATLGWAYRVIANSYASSDPWGDDDSWYTTVQLEIVAFPIIAKTPTGFRIRRGGTDEQPETRFVSREWTKMWANETPEGAVRDFIARKESEARRHEAKAAKARASKRDAECVLGEGGPLCAI